MTKKVAIIILARGKYSKRIPYKPLTMFCGKPLINWTLDITNQLPYDAYVYTDMEEIKKICKKYKCFVRDKLYENEEGIHKTKEEIIEYNKEIEADIIILMQITSPIREIELVKEWIKQFLKSNSECGIAAYKLQDGFYYDDYGFPYNYDQQKRKYNQNFSIKEDVYKETGSFYIFNFEQIHKNHFTNSDEILIFEDPYNVDINTYQDIEIAKELLCERK